LKTQGTAISYFKHETKQFIHISKLYTSTLPASHTNKAAVQAPCQDGQVSATLKSLQTSTLHSI